MKNTDFLLPLQYGPWPSLIRQIDFQKVSGCLICKVFDYIECSLRAEEKKIREKSHTLQSKYLQCSKDYKRDGVKMMILCECHHWQTSILAELLRIIVLKLSMDFKIISIA